MEIVEATPSMVSNNDTRWEQNGKQSLHHAASCGYLKIVEYLLERGAVVNDRDSSGSVPLHYATAGGHIQEILSKVVDEAFPSVPSGW